MCAFEDKHGRLSREVDECKPLPLAQQQAGKLDQRRATLVQRRRLLHCDVWQGAIAAQVARELLRGRVAAALTEGSLRTSTRPRSEYGLP